VQPNAVLDDLFDALNAGAMRPVRNLLTALNGAETAHLLESLPPTERSLAWQLIDPQDVGDVLAQLNDEVRANLIAEMEESRFLSAIDGMDLDDLADVVADIPETITQRVIHSLDERDRVRLREVLAYDEDSAGGMMNPDTVSVRPDVSLEVVLRYLRMLGELPAGSSAVFVVDRDDRYLGMLPFARIVTTDLDRNVADVMDTDTIALSADMPGLEVAREFKNKDLVSAAVTDSADRLVGHIMVDDVLDAIQEQAEHDILSMAGLDEEDDMFAPVARSSGRRAIWLGVNLATAFLAAAVVAVFEDTIEKVVVLAVLMPIVASMGGIAGSQTLTLMIRGLALGRVHRANAMWLMRKELAVGLLNGLAWAAVVAVATVLFFSTWNIGAIIALALAVNLVVAAFAGFVIPLVLRRFSIDPALAGSVILTTITDVVGLAAFLGLGTLLLT
jgi:magnesium transporter